MGKIIEFLAGQCTVQHTGPVTVLCKNSKICHYIHAFLAEKTAILAD